MSGQDWPNLVAKGRAKAIGIPWNDAEQKAIYEYQIPADYVRQGILTPEDYKEQKEKEEKTGQKPIYAKSIRELTEMARGLKINVTPDTPREVLISAILNATTIVGDPTAKKSKGSKGPQPAPEKEDDGGGGDEDGGSNEGEGQDGGGNEPVGDGSQGNTAKNFLPKGGKKPDGRARKILNGGKGNKPAGGK